MQSNAEVVKRWFREVWCEPRNAAMIDEMMVENVKLCGLNASEPLTRDDFKQLRQHLLAQYPDIQFEVTHTVESGDWIGFHVHVSGTHAESGQPIQIAGTGLAQIQGSKILESHETWDFASMLAQIGAISGDVIAREVTGV
jgi:predicted ester cyclase